MTDATASLRRTAYLLIGTVGVFAMVAKIVGAENVFEPSRYKAASGEFDYEREGKPQRIWPNSRPNPTPAFGSNDRSRWATIQALVDNGTYEVGRRSNFRDQAGPFDDRGLIFENGRQTTLDVVMNPDSGVFYSSKPPLLSTMLAGEYWLLKKVFGWNLDRDRWPVMAAILVTVNVLPFVLYLLVLAKLIELQGTTDFGKLFAFTLAALGTFLTTFSMTLNNHSPAAYAVLFAIAPLLKVKPLNVFDYLQVGFCAAFAVAMELPAAAFAAAVLLPLLYRRPKQTLLLALPAALLVAAAWFAANHAALGKFMPAYGDFGGPWYDYPGSHWKKWELVKAGQFVPGLDFNQEPTSIYAFHLLFGHHGWFSLTPALLAAGVALLGYSLVSGLSIARVFDRSAKEPIFTKPLLALMTLIVSVVVLAFYLTRTSSYNYGGNTSGPRWLFFLIPLWIVAGIHGFDWLGRTRPRQMIAALLLGFSVLSVFYPAWNPWRNPWILQMLERLEIVNYDRKP